MGGWGCAQKWHRSGSRAKHLSEPVEDMKRSSWPVLRPGHGPEKGRGRRCSCLRYGTAGASAHHAELDAADSGTRGSRSGRLGRTDQKRRAGRANLVCGSDWDDMEQQGPRNVLREQGHRGDDTLGGACVRLNQA